MSESSGVEDPWEKWILNKALQQQRKHFNKKEEARLRNEQEMLLLEKERIKDQKSREAYVRWLSEKDRVHTTEVAERQRLENDRRIERDQKNDILKQKSGENYLNWKRVKREEADKQAQVRQKEEEGRLESRRLNRLRAAEAYEQWLINHPFQILPRSPFVNPNPWVGDDELD